MLRAARLSALLAVLLLAVSACTSTDGEGDGPPPVDWSAMTSQRWRLIELGGAPIALASNVALEFEGLDRVSGHSGINQYMGTFQHIAPNALHFGSLASTRMAGPPEAMELEQAYLKALAAVDAARLTEGRLELLHQGEVAMRFEAAE